jgi:hypothetical protein
MATATTEMETEVPTSLADAQRLRDDLLFEIQQIQADLGQDERFHEDGTPFTKGEFRDWRHRAKKALSYKMDEYRAIKEWIREASRQEYSKPRNEGASRDFVKSLRCVTGGVGRLINVYDAATALLKDDTDENMAALADAVERFEELEVTDER